MRLVGVAFSLALSASVLMFEHIVVSCWMSILGPLIERLWKNVTCSDSCRVELMTERYAKRRKDTRMNIHIFLGLALFVGATIEI
jgi:predicted nucleic acid-binding Zn ribbon protein